MEDLDVTTLYFASNGTGGITTPYFTSNGTGGMGSPSEGSQTLLDAYIGRMIVLTVFPVTLVVGTIGNVLSFIVMQSGSLKHSSTSFYMAIIAVGDTCKYGHYTSF